MLWILRPVAGRDTGAFLPAMLQRIQAQIDKVRGFRMPVDRKHAALFVQFVEGRSSSSVRNHAWFDIRVTPVRDYGGGVRERLFQTLLQIVDGLSIKVRFRLRMITLASSVAPIVIAWYIVLCADCENLLRIGRGNQNARRPFMKQQ